MRLIKRLIWRLINPISKFILQPRMILGYRSLFDGNFLPNTRISNTTLINNPEKFSVADNVYIGHYNLLDASNNLMIEEGCQISSYVMILTHSSHISLRLYGRHYISHKGNKIGYFYGDVSIGAYSFIGAHSVIMPRAKIGKGSLIVAYSYVKAGDYPDFAILGGNPAVIIGDTRDTDKKYLEDYPQLCEFYNEWSKIKND